MKTATRTRSRDDRPDEQSLGLGASRRRMVALAFLVATLILASVFRIFQLQTSEREHFAAQAAELQVKSRQIYQKRGPIVDRAGGLLAQTIESCGIAIRKPVDGDGEACRSRDPVVQDLEAIVAFVAGLTGEDSDTLRRRASCRGCYCYLVRNASPALGDAIREVVGWKPEDPDAPDTNRIALQKALSGLVVEPEATRFYVGRELAGQILGAASFPDPEYLRERGRTAPIRFELQGRLGIELSYDEQLKGIPLEARGLKVRGGGTSYIFEFPELKPTGNTVVLSIDSRIQAVLEEAIDAALRRYQARWGLIIVQDVHTGELLGMAQAPLYNPNAGSSYKGNEAEWSRNRSLLERFEPGSIVKPFILAAALEEGVVDLDEIFDLEGGKWYLHGVLIEDTHPLDSSVARFLMKISSNIGFGKIGVERLGKQRVLRYLKAFGFGSRLGVDPRFEAAGSLRSEASITDVDLANMSFGQGFSATPVQVVNAFAALGNGGRVTRPILLKRILSPDGEVLLSNDPKVLRSAISGRTAATVLGTMIPVTEEGGTAPLAAIPGFLVAGKTGTADQAVPIHHPIERRVVTHNGVAEEVPLVLGWEYSEQVWRSSFVGLVPAEAPRVAIMVLLADAHFDHSGGTVAAPVFARVAPQVLRLLGVNPDGDLSHELLREPREGRPRAAVEIPQPAAPRSAAPMVGQSLVPDFTGLTVSRAMGLARESRVELKAVGAGHAAWQRPAAQSLVREGSEVVVTFRLDGGADGGTQP